MTDYGQMAQEFSRQYRPAALAGIDDPGLFFEQAGAEIEAAVTSLRDEILGPARAGESPEAFRHRSYQALRAAEEATLAGHWLFEPEAIDAAEFEDEDDPVLTAERRQADLVGRALAEAHRM